MQLLCAIVASMSIYKHTATVFPLASEQVQMTTGTFGSCWRREANASAKLKQSLLACRHSVKQNVLRIPYTYR